jgi:hypothetical protein
MNVDHHVELFNDGYPKDYRWDRDQNAKTLNIVYQSGTFGNTLKYFLDKFSSKTPDIVGDPFTAIGTCHNHSHDHFSGLIQKYHASFINDNKDNTDLPVCICVPTTRKHFLFLKKAQLFRTNDKKESPDFLWKKTVGALPEHLAKPANDLIELYGIKEVADTTYIPKFIVRDYYKLDFIQNIEDTYSYRWHEKLRTHEFFKKQKVFHLSMESFFNWETFIENITKIDDFFDLTLDFGRLDQMKEFFDRGLSLDVSRQECNLAEEVLSGENLNQSLEGLEVDTEAFIYAEIEKAYPDLQMPLTNRFFRDAREIRQFLDHYPNWYRRKNPNLG